MFIRRAGTRTTAGGEACFAHRPVESRREGDRVRQKTPLNLGRHFPVARDDWPLPFRRVDELITRQATLGFQPRGAAGRSVRSGTGRQAALAVRSSHTRRSRRGTFAVTAGFRMTAVTATLWGFPLSLSRRWSAFISGLNVRAAIAAMRGTSPGRPRPPLTWRPPLRVPLSRAKGATPTGAAAWRLPIAPGPPVQATGTPP